MMYYIKVMMVGLIGETRFVRGVLSPNCPYLRQGGIDRVVGVAGNEDDEATAADRKA